MFAYGTIVAFGRIQVDMNINKEDIELFYVLNCTKATIYTIIVLVLLKLYAVSNFHHVIKTARWTRVGINYVVKIDAFGYKIRCTSFYYL